MQNNKQTFIGWVPCVSGKLYFEFTACDVINNDGNGLLNVNHIELDPESQKQKRYFVIASEVNWEDERVLGKSGQWNVVLLSDVDFESDSLIGAVYLVPKETNYWDKHIVGILREISQIRHEAGDIKNEFLRLKENLGNLVTHGEAFAANFHLLDNGITYLQNVHQNASIDESLLICRQSYYFIKFSFHKDKHHKRSESLTTVHRLSDDANHGLLLVDDLKKALVTLARNSHPSDFKVFFAAKGILSYGKSLLNSCKKIGIIDEKAYTTEKAYFDNMAESIDVIGKKVEAEITTRTNFDNTFRSFWLFVFASIAPFTLMYKEEIRHHLALSSDGSANPSLHMVDVLKWFLENDRHLIAFFIAFIVVYVVWKKIQLRFGAPYLARDKLYTVSNGVLEFVFDNRRRAGVVLNYLKVITILMIVCTFLKAIDVV